MSAVTVSRIMGQGFAGKWILGLLDPAGALSGGVSVVLDRAPGFISAVRVARAGRYNQSFLKEINPEYLLEGLMLKLML